MAEHKPRLPHKNIREIILQGIKEGLKWKYIAANANMSTQTLWAIRKHARNEFARGGDKKWCQFYFEIMQARKVIPELETSILVSALRTVQAAILAGDEVAAQKYINEYNRKHAKPKTTNLSTSGDTILNIKVTTS